MIKYVVVAYDHFGRHADAHSGGVIYDVTLPTMGRVLVDSHNGYISSHRIVVEWENVEDKESGIRAIEVGIGSSKNSVDIHPFTEYTSRAEIAKPHLFQDGHAYYAMLKVIGLISYILITLYTSYWLPYARVINSCTVYSKYKNN